MKKYLVTGGSGFIGSEIVKKLVNSGNKVRVFDNNSRGNIRRLSSVLDKIEFIEGDIRNLQQVIDSTKDIDSVLHLAYLNGTEYFYSKPDLVLDIGIRGMLNILDACRIHKVQEFILASSSEVYQSAPIIPTPENVPLVIPDILNPRFSYGGGKLASELLALQYANTFIEKVIVFRPHNVFGPDMGWEHVIPQLSMKIIESIEKNPFHDTIELEIQGNGLETRSFIFIEEFTQALDLILKKGESRQIYHIGTQNEISISELAIEIARLLGKTLQFKYTPLLSGSTLRRCPDIKKLKSLGFNPILSIREGLEKVIPWYRDNRHLMVKLK